MICCSCGKEIDINYGRAYWNGIYCKKCADEMLSMPEYIKNYKRIIADLKAENAALRERLNITKMALEYACLETLQSNEQYLEELKEKVNKYIKQSEDVVYGQKNGVTFTFADARLKELKEEEKCFVLIVEVITLPCRRWWNKRNETA